MPDSKNPWLGPMKVNASPIEVTTVYGSRRRKNGGTEMVVEFISGQCVILEFDPDHSAQVMFAGIRGLPEAPQLNQMAPDFPAFAVDQFAIGEDTGGGSALIANFTGAGQVAMQISPELGRGLHVALGLWLQRQGK